MSETKKFRPDETGAEISGAPSVGGAPLSVPLFFSSDINVTRIISVTSEESRRDTNYFYSRPTHALIYKVSGTMVCYYNDAATGKPKELEFSKFIMIYRPSDFRRER